MALLVSAAAHLGLAYATPRAQFGQLVVLFGVALLAYAWLLRTALPWRWGLAAALGLRLLWLPAQPALSDDVYRFRWDGLLVANGVNPFRYRPDELIADGARAALPAPARREQVLPELQQLYRQLNSPHYYSVYPPICQYVFGGAAALFPTSQTGFAAVLRLVLLLAEAGTAGLLLALLAAWKLPLHHAARYLLHPLVIAELTGNLHVEGLALSLLLLMLWLLHRGRWLPAAGVLALAAATKLLPLLALPLLVRRLEWRRLLGFGLVVGLIVAVLFGPFLTPDLLAHVGSSLELYFHRFEFNASVYYLLRSVGYWLTGYNQIARLGPALALLAGLVGLALAWRERPATWPALPRTLLLMLTAYFALATIVHPWYLTLLIGLSALTRLRYPLVWGGLAVLSYATYQTPAYTENLWLVGLEYLVAFGFMTWELRAAPAASAEP